MIELPDFKVLEKSIKDDLHSLIKNNTKQIVHITDINKSLISLNDKLYFFKSGTIDYEIFAVRNNLVKSLTDRNENN